MTFLRTLGVNSLPLVAARWQVSESGTPDNRSRKSSTIHEAPLSFLFSLLARSLLPHHPCPTGIRWPMRHRPSFLSTPLSLKPETARIISRM